jgi:hypothetical protein
MNIIRAVPQSRPGTHHFLIQPGCRVRAGFPPPRHATARPTGLAVTADGTLLVTCAEDNSVGISLIFIATGLVFVVIKR